MRNKNAHHPSDDIRGSDGSELVGKRIVLCVTASVAAYRAIDLSRLLIRQGADVRAAMSKAAGMLVTPEMMKWATGNEVVTKLGGDLEHVMLADYGASDLVIVYPCTANTLGKAANGIDDTPVTSVLSIAIGAKIPIIIAPAMHQAMYENPLVVGNMEALKNVGVNFVSPVIAEGKAKVAEPEQMVQEAIIAVSSSLSLSGKKVLVTAGSTVEFIDPVRVITNLSSGKMGTAIAGQARRMGAEVTLVLGRHSVQEPQVHTNQTTTSSEMLDAVRSELKRKRYDVAVMAAAVSDYAPEKMSRSKLDTRKGSQTLKLIPTRKIIDEIKKIDGRIFLVAFKADHGVSKSEISEKAFVKLQESGADLVVANDLEKFPPGSDMNQVYVVDRQRKVIEIGPDSKEVVARKLLELIGKSLDINEKI